MWNDVGEMVGAGSMLTLMKRIDDCREEEELRGKTVEKWVGN